MGPVHHIASLGHVYQYHRHTAVCDHRESDGESPPPPPPPPAVVAHLEYSRGTVHLQLYTL